jgi:hypothetical protein
MLLVVTKIVSVSRSNPGPTATMPVSDLRVSSWIKHVFSNMRGSSVTPTRAQGVEHAISGRHKTNRLQRRMWRVSYGGKRRGKIVQLGNWMRQRRRAVRHPGYLLSLYGPNTESYATTDPAALEVTPDYGDSCAYSSQFESYTPCPPYVSSYDSYKLRAVHSQGAYAAVLSCFPHSSVDKVKSSYNKS